MLTHAENELITRVGPGTPMGALMRRFWFPIYKSAKLRPGGPPKRVRLLGENYVVFRAADNRLALFADGCPHRGLSLALARNEECAIRCIFHGWKIDVEGTVVDVPSEPSEHERFGAKVKVAKFHVREAGGIVWAFVGEGEPTQFPALPFTHLPADHVTILQIPINCNWLQAAEGQMDSSHVSNLHRSTLKTSTPNKISPSVALTQKYFLADRGPAFEVRRTNYGVRAGAIRNVGEGKRFVRVTEFCMPSWTCIPNPEDSDYLMIGQTPVDDTHSVQWYVMHNFEHPIDEDGIAHGFQSMLEYDGTSFGRIANEGNLWTQDRDEIDRGHFTGFKNLLHEDIAVAEAMGPIADRTKEYLGQSDAAITRMRRVLIEAVRDHAEGRVACGLGGDVRYDLVMGRQAVYEDGGDWEAAIAPIRGLGESAHV
jgi:phthalate 4,5-dioxygenase